MVGGQESTSDECNGEWRVTSAARSYIITPVPDRFLEDRDKFTVRKVGYIIPILFKTIFTEDATTTTLEAHG